MPDPTALPAEDEDLHYNNEIMALGDTHNIVASRDITSVGGVKLINAGTPVNSALRERMLRHKLIVDLDQSLSFEHLVDGAAIAEAALAEMETPLMRRLVQALPAHRLEPSLKRLRLNPVMAIKLTVARERRPELFRHLVQSAAMASYVARVKELDDGSGRQNLVHAALFHDLGMLHIDPALLSREGTLSVDERKHFRAHPVTLQRILAALGDYDPAVERAVLEHHERLDGTGYPRGLVEKDLSRLGRLLAVIEVTMSLMRTGSIEEYPRIETVLKMNIEKLDTGAIGCLLKLLKPADEQTTPDSVDFQKLNARLEQMTEYIKLWSSRFLPELPQQQSAEPAALIAERMRALQNILYSTGFDPDQPELLLEGIDTQPANAADLQHLIDEFHWQIKDIAHSLRLRWPALQGETTVPDLSFAQAWITAAEPFLTAEA